jgi:hypothetical protein
VKLGLVVVFYSLRTLSVVRDDAEGREEHGKQNALR